jgi:integrase/recombinase XerD
LLTGCREDELINAKRRDFDATGRTLTVLGKGNKSRVIDLNWNDGYKLFESIPAFAGKPSLFWRHEDKRVRSDSKRSPTFRGDPIEDPGPTFARLGNGTEEWAAEHGVPFVRFCFHDLRHRHAVDYLKSGGNIYDLRDRLGHETLAMTEKYLKHITPEQARIAKYGRAAAIHLVQQA